MWNLKQSATVKKMRWTAVPVAMALFGSVTAFAVSDAKETHKPEFTKVVERLAKPKLQQQPLVESYWREEQVAEGENFNSFLNRLGISDTEVHNLLAQKSFSPDLVKLRANQMVSIQADNKGGLSAIQFFSDDDDGEKILLALEKVNGTWQASANEVETVTLPTLRAVNVVTSARGALAQARVPVEIREAISEIFSDKFELDDLKEGDTVRVLYESHYFRGQEVSTGNILALEVGKTGRLYQAYYFDHGDNTGAYYDHRGKALSKGEFAKIPVNATRVSSPYGTRFHPILKTYRMHSGIDYAAPSGTPIMAPADGVVSFAGVKGGYGNAIMLNHRKGMETLYGHMSAFVSGVSAGKAVKAGDVIGFVGSTGRSTGPHLHYEVRINGQVVDPSTVALPARTLSNTEVAAFKGRVKSADQKIAAIRGLPVMVAQLD
ncbi:M23 family metallopeptidase [Vitreoscilla massiliensis]|uniref:M23 family metallopeptidase n=1 Tax=Vitreoscilla massiliensis TaxID=1689272 RepID=A0ABY4E6A1_9NEIS|nr:M23 family metallopeptidase [Vitreoscilla massiliensis]UOO90876.1 M23 family metallopeptidase [Vitreoscilla massiliensis]